MTIHSLPFEILIEIFRLCFVKEALPIYPDPYGESKPSTHLHATASTFPPPHVCKSWRNICSSCPQLYPTLSLHYRVGHETELSPVSQHVRLCTFLTLTAPHPISVSFAIESEDGLDANWLGDLYTSEEMLLAYSHKSGLLQLLEHRSRWKSATISIPFPFLQLFFLEELDYPCLKKLDLLIYSPDERGVVTKTAGEIFGLECCPDLKIITLQQGLAWKLMVPRWKSGGSHIQVLILYGLYIEYGDLCVLRECESLHTIHFDSCFALPSGDPELLKKRTLLPNVNTISWSRLFPNGDVRVTPLAFLTLPRLQNLQIQWNEGLEEEVMELYECSVFSLQKLTLIQVQRGTYRPPTEQFISLMTHLSKVESINQGLVGLELNHTDAKWDEAEFADVMDVLSLGGLDDTRHILFPFLRELTVAAYSIPTNTAFTAMLETRRQRPASMVPPVRKFGPPLGLETLRLRCPKLTFHAEALDYLETLSDEGMKVYFEPWVVSRKNWTIWNHQSYEID